MGGDKREPVGNGEDGTPGTLYGKSEGYLRGGGLYAVEHVSRCVLLLGRELCSPVSLREEAGRIRI